ncbi:calcium-binding protein [Actinoplanes sichuanensis]|uniref:Calcium-binding protein n=1 Tax=Actinoplanes sichuanensis TaxID=512349 RepID=A0ABW4A594_9ACTN|nr:calcium-binding protein [Actinoplanes sichuanensis]
MNRRTLSAIGATALAVVASPFLFSSPASAAGAGSAKVVGTNKVQFTASAGSTNSLTITISGRTVTLDDRVAIKAGRGCKAVKGDRTKVRCITAKATTRLSASLGDRNDTLRNKTSVYLYATGGSGADTLIGGSGRDDFYGGTGGDRLYGNNASDHLFGESGADRIVGGEGPDKLWAGSGDDRIWGGPGWDFIVGEGGDDIVAAGDDADYVYGSAGHDTLYGGAGEDIIGGNDGNDVIWGETGADKIEGGDGHDTIHAGSGERVTYNGAVVGDIAVGGLGDDHIFGEDDRDFIVGEQGGDELFGGAGDDYVTGGDGSDLVRGGEGDDLVAGGRIHVQAGLIEDRNGYDLVDGGTNTAVGDYCYVTVWSGDEGCEVLPADGGGEGMKRRAVFSGLSAGWQ